jgi:membrane-associated phospholipid phosphatase
MIFLKKEKKYLNKKLFLVLFLCSVCFHAQCITFNSYNSSDFASLHINSYHSNVEQRNLLLNMTNYDTTADKGIIRANTDTLRTDLPEYKPNNSFWTIAVSSVALTVVLIPSDNDTYTFFRKLKVHNSLINSLSPVITQLGNGNFSCALFGGFGIYHFISGNEKTWDVAKVGIESFFLSGATVQILKNIFSRQRPSEATKNGGKWNGVFSRYKKRNKGETIADFDSFPSGHTTTAFAAASTLSYFYPDGAVPYIAYSLATAIAVSRVMEQTHWVSDCVLGAGLGYLSTLLVVKWNYSPANASVGITPVNKGLALNIGYKF